jgi:hypothetical protein
MSKIYFLLLLIFVFTSCTIKEKVIINEDGSGTFFYGFDVSALMKMGTPSDSTKAPKVMDSTFTFKEILAPLSDSIAQLSAMEKAQFKLLENFRIKMKINEVKKEFSYDMEFDFPAVDSLNNMVSPTKAGSLIALSDKKIPSKKITSEKTQSNTTFSYDGNYFIKTVTAVDGVSKANGFSKKKTKSKKKAEPLDDLTKKLEELIKQCKYIVEYHFPKRIKSTSLKNVTLSPDKKSFILEIPMENLQENMDLSFKVEFE